MKVSITKTKNDVIYYISKGYRIGNKTTTKNVLKVGKHSELILTHPDPLEYCKELAKKMTLEEKESKSTFLIKLSEETKIKHDCNNHFNIGYLFLQKIYHELKLDEICDEISENYKFKYNLNDILKSLVFSRVIYPGSKLSTFEDCKNFLEQPSFELHDIYRALDPLAKHLDFIQSQLYKNSKKVIKRNTSVLYYDCTNYFFQIEQADELRKYGVSKEHRPLPIVQMGLFLDGNGIPLAFNINPGNTSEQITVRPTEETIIKDFGLSKFIYCSDAGLGSYNNRWFNSIQNRAFIVTQSLNKLPKDVLKIIFENNNINWTSLNGQNKFKSLDDVSDSIDTVYKKIPLTDKQIQIMIDNDKYPAELKNQSLIVSFSKKYKMYQQRIRLEQFERAKKLIESKSKFNKTNINDCKRFIKNMSFDKNGELIDNTVLELDIELFNKESKFDGYYCVATNLEDDIETIITINHRRWEIEESFRIMKTDFLARPVFVSLEDHIKSHFLTCFIALLIYRILESRLNNNDNNFTSNQIFDCLKKFSVLNLNDVCFTPTFTRSLLTDRFEEVFNIKCHSQAISHSTMNKNIKFSKSSK